MANFLSETSSVRDKELEEHEYEFFNPLAQPISKWYELHKLLKLFPWWIKYNIGTSDEFHLKDKIIEIGQTLGLSNVWMNKIIKHAITEFSKKGLGIDYYGYHNIYHELEATYFTLLAASDKNKLNKFNLDDIKYLFLASLFHDFDPSKRFDKPNEEEVEWFIRKDKKIMKYVHDEGLNADIMIAMIYRTAYPFKDDIAKNATEKMNRLLTKSGISDSDNRTRKHYYDLGWFLSVSERISGYALGNFDRAMELARLNAHGLGWHPSIINRESVKYFKSLNGEQEMLDRILNSVSIEYKENFLNTVTKFNEEWNKEIEIKSSLKKNKISLLPLVEKNNEDIDPVTLKSIINIRNDLKGSLLSTDKRDFANSVNDPDTILITLRVKEENNKIVGFVKGGPLEDYTLRRGTIDVNFGKKNTVFIESTYIKSGYWGQRGGHLLRHHFLNHSKNLGYNYVTGYVHRDVLLCRNGKGEPIETVQKYDPDKLDYYRLDLNNFKYVSFT